MPICQYCKANMSTISSLNNHQKKTRKCLIIQGITPIGEFKCTTCTSTFLTKYSLSNHTVSCIKKCLPETNAVLKQKNDFLESKYSMLLEDYKKLEAKYDAVIEKITIEALSKKNKTTINTTNNNISVFDRTDEEIKNIYADNLTVEHIAGGVQSIAKLIVDKVIRDVTGKPMITITDKSRGNAKYKLSTGEVVLDNGLDKFTEKHRDLIVKRMYHIASNPEHYLDFLDTDSKTCSGYNEMIDDTEGVNLKKNIIKNI